MKAFPSFVFVVLAAGAANAQIVRKRRKLTYVEKPLARCTNGITQGCLDQTCSTAERDCYFSELSKCFKEKTECIRQRNCSLIFMPCEETYDFCKLEHELGFGPGEVNFCTTAEKECKNNCGVYSGCENRCEMIIEGVYSHCQDRCEMIYGSSGFASFCEDRCEMIFQGTGYLGTADLCGVENCFKEKTRCEEQYLFDELDPWPCQEMFDVCKLEMEIDFFEGSSLMSMQYMPLETIAGGESMPSDEQVFYCDMQQLREEKILAQCLGKCRYITEKSRRGFEGLRVFFDQCRGW